MSTTKESTNSYFNIDDKIIYDSFTCEGKLIIVLDAKKVNTKGEEELIFTRAEENKDGNIVLTQLTDEEIEIAMKAKNQLAKILGGKNE